MLQSLSACTENRNSRAQTRNKIDMGDLFEIFPPNTRVLMDFAERSGEEYLVMCDQMSGFLQVYKVRNKGSS